MRSKYVRVIASALVAVILPALLLWFLTLRGTLELRHIGIGAALGAVVAFVLASLLWYPRSLTEKRRGKPTDDKLLEFEASTRNTVAQLCVGLAGFLVIYVALSNLQLADQQQIDAQFLQGVKLVNARGDASESDEDGSGPSANGNADVVGRVGGIFALENVVERRSSLRGPVLHLLAALVRREASKNVHAGPCGWLDKHPDRHPYRAGRDHETLADDVRAAMLVIGRLASEDHERIDLSQTELCISFSARANFLGTNLRDSDLRGSILDCANLENTVFTGANLQGVHMPGVELRDLWLDGDTSFAGADLSCARLAGYFGGASFQDANLSHADLSAATGLTQDQLDKACGTDVKLPQGLQISPCTSASFWASVSPACSTSRDHHCR